MAGFPGNETPQLLFPSIVGRPKSVQSVAGLQNNDTYVGGERCAKAGILILKASIGRSIVTKWHGMEKIGGHTVYNEVCGDPIGPTVLLTEALMNPKRIARR
jgi:actin-related protein